LEFERGDERLAIDVPGSVTIDESNVALAFVRSGVGLLFGPEPVVAPFAKSGELQLVLEDWATWGPGYHIYYPSRRQVRTGLRLLIELVSEMRPLGI
jgi:DNA-binding transcriptional LysR family regulator